MTVQGAGPLPRRGAMILLLPVLVGLNFLLTFHNAWPTPWVRLGKALSIELALGVLLVALHAECFRTSPRRILSGLAAIFLLLVIGRYAAVTAPALYGRRINLYWDAQHIPAVAAMVAEAAPAWLVVLAVAALLVLLAAIYGVLRWSLGQVANALAQPRPRRFLLGLGFALCGLYFGGHASETLRTEKWFATPVSRTFAEQAGLLLDAVRADDSIGALGDGLPPASDLARVRDTDVFVVFLESYGATAYDTARFAQAMEQGLDRLERTIDETGHKVVSAFLVSPTFGSGSWRAHLSLLSGVEVGDEHTYKLLMTTERPTLVERFAAAGHRTVALMPGLKRAWPEGAFYRFDRIYGESALDYRGPGFGWWRIPDQYALARLHQTEVRPAERPPLFVVFPTISSHAPFRPTPPYQPDWQRVLTASPYAADILEEALASRPEWNDPGAGYADAMRYSLALVAGYLRERGGRERLMVVLGDHQPPSSVSGADASWEVPVHVIARDPAILESLVASGFRPGVIPRRPALGPVHELASMLLAAFDTGEVVEPGLPATLARSGGP